MENLTDKILGDLMVIKKLKIKYSTLNNRINTNKWDIEKAFTQPLRKGGKYIDF